MSTKIPLSRVHQSETIDRRILEVVKGGNYILGPECKAFEAELAAYFGVRHVVLSSSWTAAVHLLHLAQDLKPGDEILVPSLTAFPSIEPMIHAGAKRENDPKVGKIFERARRMAPTQRIVHRRAIERLVEHHDLMRRHERFHARSPGFRVPSGNGDEHAHDGVPLMRSMIGSAADRGASSKR